MRQESSSYYIEFSEIKHLMKKLDRAGYAFARAGDVETVSENGKVMGRIAQSDPGERMGFEMKIDNFPDSERLDWVMRQACKEFDRHT